MSRLLTWLWMLRVLLRAGMIPLMRPDKYLRQGLAVRRHGAGPLSGLSLSAVRNPHGLALVDERGNLTWRELDRRADAVAVGLAALGADRSAPVGILCRNHRGLVESLAAASRIGADALLLNTGFSGPQLSEVVRREGARVLVCDEEFLPLVEHARAEDPDLVVVLAWVDSATSPSLDSPSLDTLVEEHLGSRPPGVGDAGAGRVVLLTSGTTGTPKGARRGASGGGPALAAMFDRIPWRAEEPIVVAAPAFHAFGFGAVAIAFTLACPVVLRRRFDPEATLDLLVRHDATALAVVPVMIERIADLPASVLDRYQPSRLRFVTASGSRMRPDAVLSFMDRFGEVIYNSYNATEPGLISTATPADLRVAPDTAGRPMAGSEVVILDDSLQPVPAGEIGKIAVFNGAQFEGYTSGDTKEFHGRHMMSGDLGRFDADGRLYVVGRDDDMIVSGGENVYPLEVEQCLLDHDEVLECAVVGVEDEAFGQRLAAYVVLRPGGAADADALKAHVKSRLAGYKVPRDVELLAELPRNASGKVLTRELGSYRQVP
jgi:acyl-CoA synthetase (AMP-forming)/AMP-acid ligase II